MGFCEMSWQTPTSSDVTGQHVKALRRGLETQAGMWPGTGVRLGALSAQLHRAQRALPCATLVVREMEGSGVRLGPA